MLHIFKKGLSLKTQVYGLIIIISIISFFVRIITDVDTTRNYLQTQMGSHAQDTATSLGLSISPYLEEDSIMIAQTMATAIFDSGYYSEIKFIDVENKVVIDLENPKSVESVPNWLLL
nr:LapD/MoxY N-terminal periplasmic domain-containing protein [Pseudoalteromonas sp. WY3]